MIHLDISNESVVITCSQCAHWSAFQFGRAEAEEAGIRHEMRAHPEDTAFRRRVQLRREKERQRKKA